MYPIAEYATICAGGIIAPIAASLVPRDAAYLFELVQPKVVFCSADLLLSTKEICEKVRIPHSSIYIVSSSPQDIINAVTGQSLIGVQSLQWQRVTDPNVLSSTTAQIIFTSGTSGLPKCIPFLNCIDLRGVELTHQNMTVVGEQWSCTWFSRKRAVQPVAKPGDAEYFRVSVLCHLPMSHVSVSPRLILPLFPRYHHD